MVRDKAAMKAAYYILAKYKVYNITVETLIYIIESNDYEIIEFSRKENSPAVEGLIREINMSEFVKNTRGFTYCDGMNRLVFIDEDLTADEKLCVLAHELGHIVCGHLRSRSMISGVFEEYEANEFAHYLLHPGRWHRFKVRAYENRRTAVIGIAVAAVLAVGTVIAVNARNEKIYYGDYYVTEHGEKYHKKSCIYIDGRDSVRRLTREEYYSGEYEPCSVCLPEGQ